MKRAVLITGPGFEDSEVVYPFYRLQEAGIEVDVVTSNDNPVKGKHGVPIAPTRRITELDAEAYDAVIIPGGHEAPDRVRQVPEILRFAREMSDRGKVIASICHGPWVLISAGILKGKRATCYKGCKDDLINAGAEYVDAPVVVDGKLVTSPHFRNLAPWMKATLTVLNADGGVPLILLP